MGVGIGTTGTTRVLRLGSVAFALNWAWEATHAVAYVESAGPLLFRLRHCLPMAAVDAVWTLALCGAALILVRRSGCQRRYFATLGALGALTATWLERWALAEGRWTYNALMPIVPVVGVGLWPVMQMALLPCLAMWWAYCRTRKVGAGDRDPSSNRHWPQSYSV